MALELAVRSLAGGDAALDEAVETVQAEETSQTAS